MESIEKFLCTCNEPAGLERLSYVPRQLLTADDMRAEQEYFREKQRRHNRLLHGWGVVCGLEVVKDTRSDRPFWVNVRPGYALGPYGDEICVPEEVPLDLTHCARPPVACDQTLGDPPPLGTTPILVRIRYAECKTRPIRTLPAGCGCDETACEYSRIRDGFEVQCIPVPAEKLKKLLVASREPAVGKTGQLQKDKARPCPPCPSDPWVPLAQISPSKKTEDGVVVVVVDETLIHNEVRKVVA
jgi:hypothetical protein